jgi:hypothetical protein
MALRLRSAATYSVVAALPLRGQYQAVPARRYGVCCLAVLTKTFGRRRRKVAFTNIGDPRGVHHPSHAARRRALLLFCSKALGRREILKMEETSSYVLLLIVFDLLECAYTQDGWAPRSQSSPEGQKV